MKTNGTFYIGPGWFSTHKSAFTPTLFFLIIYNIAKATRQFVLREMLLKNLMNLSDVSVDTIVYYTDRNTVCFMENLFISISVL